MKLLACALLLLVLFPFSAIAGLIGLRGDSRSYKPTELASVAQPGGGSGYRVAVDGYLLRAASPDAARMKLSYVLPFVTEAEANAAVAAGTVEFPPESTPVFVEVPGDELPVEIFMRSEDGGAGPVAVPYTLEGTKRALTEKAPPVVARIKGAGGGREIVLLKADPNRRLTRGEGIVFAAFSLLWLFFGVRLFRSWRRDRRERRQAVARIMAERAGQIIPRAGKSAPSGRRASGGGFDMPWGKIAGVLVMVGVVGAKVGKAGRSAVDDVARTALRSADEVGSAARQSDSLTTGERALEHLGTALDVESAAEVVYDVATLGEEGGARTGSSGGARLPQSSKSISVNLSITTTDAAETYFADHWFRGNPRDWSREEQVDITPLPGEPLQFELYASRAEASMSGSITGFPRINGTATDSTPPRRTRGEFTRIELAPSGDGVRLTHRFAFAFEGGYVEVFEATADLEYLNGGTWTELCTGRRPITLGFTEAGRDEYARTIAPSYARAAENSLLEEGIPGLRLRAVFETPPEEFIEIDHGRLLLSLRNESVIRLSGGK